MEYQERTTLKRLAEELQATDFDLPLQCKQKYFSLLRYILQPSPFQASTSGYNSAAKMMEVSQGPVYFDNDLQIQSDSCQLQPQPFEYAEQTPVVKKAKASGLSKGGRKPADPWMEAQLGNWVIQMLQSGRLLTSRLVISKSKQFCTAKDFKFSKGWFCRFKARLIARNTQLSYLTVKQIRQL